MKQVRELAGLLLMALACLLCWDVDRTVNSVSNQIPMAVERFNASLGKLDSAAQSYNARGQEISDETLDLIGSTDKAVTHLTTTVDTYNAAGKKLPAVLESVTFATDTLNVQLEAIGQSATRSIDSVQPLSRSGTQAFTSINALITDPAVKHSLYNVDAVTGNMAQATGDLAKKEHELFFPAPCTHLCGLHRAYQIGKGIVGFAEPAYYMKGLF